MEINKILSSDILDLLFEDRNKAYGAYELRKTYKKRLTIALLCTAAVALLALGGSFLGYFNTGHVYISLVLRFNVS